MLHRCTVIYLLLSLWGIYVQSTLPEDAFESTDPCVAKAWVRAPDLVPGRVIPGEMRVKLNGQCPEVLSYTLGLRFAERSWVKTGAKGVNLSEPLPIFNVSSNQSDNSIYKLGHFARFDIWPNGGETSEWETYRNKMMNPALWLAQEEERVGFETRESLSDGKSRGFSRDLVRSFAILVPNTNYPPTFDMPYGDIFSFGQAYHAAEAEHIYAYFVEVNFVNGTTREVPAGYTSFRSVSRLLYSGSETISVVATPFSGHSTTQRTSANDSETHESIPQDKFTLEVTFPHGRNVSQGSKNIVSVISHQIGPGLRRPLYIGYNLELLRKCEWGANHAADDETAEKLRTSCSSTIKSQRPPERDTDTILGIGNTYKTNRFSQLGKIENGTTFSTESIDMQLKIDENSFPTFTMNYHTVEHFLRIFLHVRDIMYDDEQDWAPNDMKTTVLFANIPLIVHPHLEDSTLENPEAVHYLSEGARSPIFVDPSSVEQLVQKTVEDRDMLAPLVQARFETFSDGNIVKNRYYGNIFNKDSRQWYVGKTWLKVLRAKEDEKEYGQPTDTLLQLQV